MSSLGFSAFVGLRYTFSPKNHRFTTLVSLISMFGMVLGVSSLITVLSVMNGFAAELRSRILSLVPHATVEFPEAVAGRELLAAHIAEAPGVVDVSPMLRENGLLSAHGSRRPARLEALDPGKLRPGSALASALGQESLDALVRVPFGVVLGEGLARALALEVGDRVVVTVPRVTRTPAGVFPRSKRLLVVGLFSIGAQQDGTHAFISLETGDRLLGTPPGGPMLRIETRDALQVASLLSGIAAVLPESAEIRLWSETQGSLFRAMRMEKVTVTLLLLSVVAVAAFNIVSCLAMSVADKRTDIAVLRTMGASASTITVAFLTYGLCLALLGIAIGTVAGVALALSIPELSVWLEALIGARLFDPTVYFITAMPSELRIPDVLMTVASSILLAGLASVYPSWRAARIAPAEALRYG